MGRYKFKVGDCFMFKHNEDCIIGQITSETTYDRIHRIYHYKRLYDTNHRDTDEGFTTDSLFHYRSKAITFEEALAYAI